MSAAALYERARELMGELQVIIDEMHELATDGEGGDTGGAVGVGDGFPSLDNQADIYGVRVDAPAHVVADRYFRCTKVYHLSPGENRGGHQIYVRVVDEYGTRDYNPDLRIGWSWEGKRPNEIAKPALLDKSDALSERGHGNLDIYAGQKIMLWIESVAGGTQSDMVANLHSSHPDEHGPNGEIWNSIGHHSYIVEFTRVDL